MLAKLETAKAGLRIKMFTLDLWARCTTFVSVEVARPYLNVPRVWNLGQWQSGLGRPPNQFNLHNPHPCG